MEKNRPINFKIDYLRHSGTIPKRGHLAVCDTPSSFHSVTVSIFSWGKTFRFPLSFTWVTQRLSFSIVSNSNADIRLLVWFGFSSDVYFLIVQKRNMSDVDQMCAGTRLFISHPRTSYYFFITRFPRKAVKPIRVYIVLKTASLFLMFMLAIFHGHLGKVKYN